MGKMANMKKAVCSLLNVSAASLEILLPEYLRRLCSSSDQWMAWLLSDINVRCRLFLALLKIKSSSDSLIRWS